MRRLDAADRAADAKRVATSQAGTGGGSLPPPLPVAGYGGPMPVLVTGGGVRGSGGGGSVVAPPRT